MTLGILLSWLIILTAGPTLANNLTGREIMEKVKASRAWENEVARVSFLMISKEKKTRMRHVIRRRKHYRGNEDLDTKTQLVFQYPPKYHNYAYLSWSYRHPKKRDLKWVYNPDEVLHFKPIKRLVYDLRDRFLSFWLEGNDFTYEDLTERPVEADKHTFLRIEVYNFKSCYVVESVPLLKRDNNQAKRIYWIWKDHWLPLKVDFYDSKGTLERTLYNHWTQEQRFWTLKQSLMKDHKSQHLTIMRVDKVEYNTKLSDIFFNPSFLSISK
jgi:hypothetical protein